MPLVDDDFMTATYGGIHWIYVADEDSSMMFPPVKGIVPDEVAVDLAETEAAEIRAEAEGNPR